MRVRLLGTAAGGGFPQWNCGCDNCRAVRTGLHGALPRTQSCTAVSADGKHWFLLNASPDIRIQIESFSPLLPPENSRRGTGIAGVLVTNADLDHTLGLFILREGHRLNVHATPAVRDALSDGLALDRTLSSYCGVEWCEPPIGLMPLLCPDGSHSGLRYAAFRLAGKPPKYREHLGVASADDCVGYRITDEATGGRLVCMPDVGRIDADTLAEMRDCDLLLLDGTFWSEREMQEQRVGTTPAGGMGHLPVGGPDGSLALIAPLIGPRKIYVHLNNTNPMLLADSAERAAVEAAGCEVGYDGMELVV